MMPRALTLMLLLLSARANPAEPASGNKGLCLFQTLLATQRHYRTSTSTVRWYRDETPPLEKTNVVGAHERKITQEDDKEYDPITDWIPPPPNVVQQTIKERIKPLRRLTSPVFFSTDTTGRRVRGLGYLPSNRPLLIVGNHQLGGIDIWLIVPELIQQRNMFVRGLGHPVIFQDEQAHLKGGPTFLPDTGKQGTFGLYQRFGAVMATPRNLYKLLASGGSEAILHFPGGAREAYHGKKEAYQLFWPTKLDFVRMAAKFNATIVPLAGIGAADSVYFFADPDALLNLPLGLNKVVENSFLTVQQAARFDQQDEPFIRPPPLVLPKLLPARHYFLFGKPFDTYTMDPKDKKACRKLYQDVQAELNHGLEDLVRARQQDPFQDSFSRFAYEQVTGKQAPTFSVKELNV